MEIVQFGIHAAHARGEKFSQNERDAMDHHQLGKKALHKTKTLRQPHILSYQITNQLTEQYFNRYFCVIVFKMKTI